MLALNQFCLGHLCLGWDHQPLDLLQRCLINATQKILLPSHQKLFSEDRARVIYLLVGSGTGDHHLHDAGPVDLHGPGIDGNYHISEGILSRNYPRLLIWANSAELETLVAKDKLQMTLLQLVVQVVLSPGLCRDLSSIPVDGWLVLRLFLTGLNLHLRTLKVGLYTATQSLLGQKQRLLINKKFFAGHKNPFSTLLYIQKHATTTIFLVQEHLFSLNLSHLCWRKL